MKLTRRDLVACGCGVVFTLVLHGHRPVLTVFDWRFWVLLMVAFVIYEVALRDDGEKR